MKIKEEKIAFCKAEAGGSQAQVQPEQLINLIKTCLKKRIISRQEMYLSEKALSSNSHTAIKKVKIIYVLYFF